MSLKTPLAKVRGLGSAKEGVHHWWMQRVSGAALVPLTLWFVFSIVTMTGSDYTAVTAWASAPVNTVLLVLLVATTFHHTHLGLQVVIEDYVHNGFWKLVLLIGIKWLSVILSVAAIIAVLKVAFGG